MRKMMLSLAALLLIVSAKIVAAQTAYTDYDSHIDDGGIVHCVNEGHKCRSW